MKRKKKVIIIGIGIIVLLSSILSIVIYNANYNSIDIQQANKGWTIYDKSITNIKENMSIITEADGDFEWGSLKDFVYNNEIDESIFKAMLVKMGLSQSDFDTNIQDMSEGQKKKVLIAKSISEQANIYIWDEPLNYIDILTREQIEDAILKYNPTLIFVEHDETFIEKVATKIIKFER